MIGRNKLQSSLLADNQSPLRKDNSSVHPAIANPELTNVYVVQTCSVRAPLTTYFFYSITKYRSHRTAWVKCANRCRHNMKNTYIIWKDTITSLESIRIEISSFWQGYLGTGHPCVHRSPNKQFHWIWRCYLADGVWTLFVTKYSATWIYTLWNGDLLYLYSESHQRTTQYIQHTGLN